MVTIFQRTKLNEDNELAVPDDVRQRLGLNAGDSVMWSIDDDGAVRIRRHYTADELCGIFPLLPGVETDGDFDDLIHEAFEEGYARKFANERPAE